MHRLKLTYFDFDGGRGEPARLIMRFANIDFKDDRIAIADWPQIKTDYRYHQLPELEVDGTVLTQTNAINRFVGKLAGLYPTDNWQAALCDEIIDTADDALQLIARTFSMSEEDKKVAREAAVAGPLPMFLAGLNSALLARGGEYFVDGRLTVADFKVVVLINTLTNGSIDYVSTDLVAGCAPELLVHKSRIDRHIAQGAKVADFA